jgi:hypothetical protein
MSIFDYADKEKLAALVRKARALRQETARLHEKSQALRKLVEEQAAPNLRVLKWLSRVPNRRRLHCLRSRF